MIRLFLSLFIVLLFSSVAVANQVETINNAQLDQLLEKNKGKVVFVNFFASWCPPCREEIPGLINAYKKFKNRGFEIIGLSLDQDKEAYKKFVKDYKINYPVYVAEYEVALRYKASLIPHNAIYDRSGKLIVNQAGLVHEAALFELLEDLLKR